MNSLKTTIEEELRARGGMLAIAMVFLVIGLLLLSLGVIAFVVALGFFIDHFINCPSLSFFITGVVALLVAVLFFLVSMYRFRDMTDFSEFKKDSDE